MRVMIPRGRVARRAVPVVVGVLLGALVACSDDSDSSANSGASKTPMLLLFAGSAPGARNVDGFGAVASFRDPSGLAIDAGGNIYVADTGTSTIRKITPSGRVTILAGIPGAVGSTDGARATARFNEPSGVAVDGSGNVFVADTGNSTIRMISSAGVVTTVAGASGLVGSADGSASIARFNKPSDVAVDGSGTLYVADTGNSTIRAITPAGLVKTVAGKAGSTGSADGIGTMARFKAPNGLAIEKGAVLVADTGNHIIRKISSSGAVTTLAGVAGAMGYADASGGLASFHLPRALTVDGAGNVYVADTLNNTIRKITPAGLVTTLSGIGGVDGNADGDASVARFSEPSGAVADRAGNIIVADKVNNIIRKVAPDGSVRTLAGSAIRYDSGREPQSIAGSEDATGPWARFNEPSGLTVDRSGNVYVTEVGNNTVRKITRDGVVTTLAGSEGDAGVGFKDASGSSARFDSPLGVAADAAGNLYVADMGNGAIRKVSSSGTVTTFAKGLAGPRGVAVDSDGNVYVADAAGVSKDIGGVKDRTGQSVIRKITSAGLVTIFAGPTFDANDGTGRTVEFRSPRGMATDHAGNVYVADSGNNAIRKISAAGVVTTVAGASGMTGSDDGPADRATFNLPLGVATDADGDVYVADTGNNTIRKITPAGTVSTIAGQPAISGFMPGRLPGQLTAPVAVAISGNTLYTTTADAIVKVTNLP